MIKNGVRVRGLTPEILLAVLVSYSAYSERRRDLVITSVMDGKHRHASKHYSGNAVDIRTRNVPISEREGMRDTISTSLGNDYDVILENDHIHIEYDPKEYYTE